MASYYVPLPAARAPGPLNFEPINRGLDSLGSAMKENRLLAQQKDIGNALATGGYGEAADKAFSMGDLRTGLSLTQAEASEEDRDYQRQRQAVADQRAAAAASRAAAAENRAASAFDDKRRDALVNRISGVAQLIRNEADPARKAQMMQAFARNPRIKSQLDSVGFDPASPDTTLDMIIAEARGLTTPKGSEYKTFSEGQGIYRAGPSGLEVVREPTPKAGAAAAKFSEGATKAANFANMMRKAEGEINANAPRDAQGNVVNQGLPKGFWGWVREGIVPEGFINTMRPQEYQEYRQAAMQWVRAKLRKESGAAISADEFEGEFETFFPQVGDSQASIDQKARARHQATLGMVAESRGAYQELFGGPDTGAVAPQTGQTGAPIQVNSQQEYQRLQPGQKYIAPDGSVRTKQ